MIICQIENIMLENNKNMKKIYKTIIWLVLAIALVLVFSLANTSEKEDIVKIGGAFTLTGEASAWGEMAKNGTLLAIDEINSKNGINGKKIELILEDTQSSNVGTISAVNKLINIDKVSSILGPGWLDVYSGAAPLAEDNNLIFITPDSGISAINKPKIHKNVFSLWYRTDHSYPALVRYMKSLGIKKIAMVAQNDPFYKDAAENVSKAAKENHIELLEIEFVNSGEADLKTSLLKIKSLDPEALIYGLYDKRATINLLQTAKNIMPNIKLFSDVVIEDFVGTEGFVDLLENNVFITPPSPDKEFRNKFLTRYGKEPTFGASNAYDAAYILVEGLKANSEELDLNKYFREKYFDTISFGKMTFDEMGGVKTENRFNLKKVINNQIIILKENFKD